MQAENATRLAAIAAERNLDVDARRLYVKTWVSLLELQNVTGERKFDPDELSRRYQGSFDSLRRADSDDFEP